MEIGRMRLHPLVNGGHVGCDGQTLVAPCGDLYSGTSGDLDSGTWNIKKASKYANHPSIQLTVCGSSSPCNRSHRVGKHLVAVVTPQVLVKSVDALVMPPAPRYRTQKL